MHRLCYLATLKEKSIIKLEGEALCSKNNNCSVECRYGMEPLYCQSKPQFPFFAFLHFCFPFSFFLLLKRHRLLTKKIFDSF